MSFRSLVPHRESPDEPRQGESYTLIIDGFHALLPSETYQGTSRIDLYNETSAALKSLSIRLNLSVMVTARYTPRHGEVFGDFAAAILSELEEYGNLAHDADVIMALKREETASPQGAERNGKAEPPIVSRLLLVKSHLGTPCAIRIWLSTESQRFDDYEKEPV